MPETPIFYSAASEFGLDGKWPPAVRLSGLEALADASAGKTVLDLGAAEGFIARRFLSGGQDGGAALLHGFEFVPERVTAARRICARYGNAMFWQADLSHWDAFRSAHAEHLLARYEIVLYLGLHHHLPALCRGATLAGAAAMSCDVLALRMPDDCYAEEQVAEQLSGEGFRLSDDHRSAAFPELGPLRIFRRRQVSGVSPR
jgi:hypothetical protein